MAVNCVHCFHTTPNQRNPDGEKYSLLKQKNKARCLSNGLSWLSLQVCHTRTWITGDLSTLHGPVLLQQHHRFVY